MFQKVHNPRHTQFKFWLTRGSWLGLGTLLMVQGVPGESWAARSNQVSVTLFQQPCLLVGPFPAKQLSNIHQISPEQIPSAIGAGQVPEALNRLEKTTDLPRPLSPYRAQLQKRLKAQESFFQALAQGRSKKTLEPVLQAVKKHTSSNQGEILSRLLKRTAKKQPIEKWDASTIQPMTDAYNDAIEAHPEEDFHRIIRSLDVHYQCSFEEADSH